MKIYIASSWKNRHAVEMLTALLRQRKHEVLSFVENSYGENGKAKNGEKPLPFDEWVWSEEGRKAFEYDVRGATESDLVVYIGPSGKDAAAEVGAARARGVPVLGLHAKGEDFGLMRRLIEWHQSYETLLEAVRGYGARMDKIARTIPRKVITHSGQGA